VSKRILAPIVLLLAAACSAVAVFAVQRIESGIGPFNEPYASQYLSPNGDHVRDDGSIRFTTKRPERVTITLEDSSGHVVKTIRRNARVDGAVPNLTWHGVSDDGVQLPDGTYRIVITRAGDRRRYGPAKPTIVDTRPLRAQLAVARRRGDNLGGLIFTQPGIGDAYLELADGSHRVPAFSTTRQDVATSLPGSRPAGLVSVRFLLDHAAKLDLQGASFVLEDLAGNPTRLPLAGVLEEAS
jgi:hypothetical protein